MKKTLITLAALAAMTAQSMAADVTTDGSALGNGTNWTVGVGVKTADGSAGTTFAQGDNVTVNNAFGVNLGEDITVGTLNVNALINLRPSGEYQLTVNDVVNVNAGGSYNLYMDHSAKIDMNGGTMNIGGYWASNEASGTAKVTLTVKDNSSLDLGTVNVNAGSTIHVLGETKVGAAYSGAGTLTLNNGSHLTGAEDAAILLENGTIKATGTGNTVSADLKQAWNLNVDVAADSDLTFSGDLISTEGVATFVKTGEGTLVVDNTTMNTAFTVNHNGGTLDLSDVTTLGTLNVADSTTLVLGDSPITLTGALTMGQNVTIDLSAWCSNTGENGKTAFDPYMTIFSYADDSSLSFDALEGLRVTLIVDGFTNTNAWLTVANGGKSLQLVPEPTTATLSLLALAGLAARRRRK